MISVPRTAKTSKNLEKLEKTSKTRKTSKKSKNSKKLEKTTFFSDKISTSGAEKSKTKGVVHGNRVFLQRNSDFREKQ